MSKKSIQSTSITEHAAWETKQNVNASTVNWQFRTPDARIKLQSLYATFTNTIE